MSIRKRPGGGYISTLLEAGGVADHLFGTAECAPESGFLVLKQVHSARVLPASQWREGLEGDGLHSATAGVRMAVKTADCIPLLIWDPARRAAAAVHAGWRGVVQNIAGAAVRALEACYRSRAEDLLAAMGPAIGACCYEVGPEVAVQFEPLFPERTDLRGPTKLDLREAVRRQLVASGLQNDRIDVALQCTCCGGREFHSWRRDRQTGRRMYAVIAVPRVR